MIPAEIWYHVTSYLTSLESSSLRIAICLKPRFTTMKICSIAKHYSTLKVCMSCYCYYRGEYNCHDMYLCSYCILKNQTFHMTESVFKIAFRIEAILEQVNTILRGKDDILKKLLRGVIFHDINRWIDTPRIVPLLMDKVFDYMDILCFYRCDESSTLYPNKTMFKMFNNLFTNEYILKEKSLRQDIDSLLEIRKFNLEVNAFQNYLETTFNMVNMHDWSRDHWQSLHQNLTFDEMISEFIWWKQVFQRQIGCNNLWKLLLTTKSQYSLSRQENCFGNITKTVFLETIRIGISLRHQPFQNKLIHTVSILRKPFGFHLIYSTINKLRLRRYGNFSCYICGENKIIPLSIHYMCSICLSSTFIVG